MKTIAIALALVINFVRCSPASEEAVAQSSHGPFDIQQLRNAQSAKETALTNHMTAVTFLGEFEELTGQKFHANPLFENHNHFDGGRKLLGYITEHKDDTNVAERVLVLAKSWANMARANEEMKQDTGSRLAWLWFTRTHFAWGVLTKSGLLREGMNYDDAVTLLGTPHGHKETFPVKTEVMWVLGGGLRTQTWIKAVVDPTRTIVKMTFRWT